MQIPNLGAKLVEQWMRPADAECAHHATVVPQGLVAVGYVTSGECYLTNPHTGRQGKCPSNLSGGLLGTTHAVGATGIWQCGEVLWQLQGKYDQFHGDPALWQRYGKTRPDDWQSLQVKDPRRGMAISHAGIGSHVVCSILEKAW